MNETRAEARRRVPTFRTWCFIVLIGAVPAALALILGRLYDWPKIELVGQWLLQPLVLGGAVLFIIWISKKVGRTARS